MKTLQYRLRVYDAATWRRPGPRRQHVDARRARRGPRTAVGSRTRATSPFGIQQVRSFDFTSGTATDVTDGLAPGFDPRFDRTGRWLSYLRLESDGAGGRGHGAGRARPADGHRAHGHHRRGGVRPARRGCTTGTPRGYVHLSPPSDFHVSVFAGFGGSFTFSSVRLAPGPSELVARSVDCPHRSGRPRLRGGDRHRERDAASPTCACWPRTSRPTPASRWWASRRCCGARCATWVPRSRSPSAPSSASPMPPDRRSSSRRRSWTGWSRRAPSRSPASGRRPPPAPT